jgi:YHS domain-containing protein
MTIAQDPVCGMDVEVEGAPAALTFDYKGVTYYFCGKGCRLEFVDDPERYLDPSYEPTM